MTLYSQLAMCFNGGAIIEVDDRVMGCCTQNFIGPLTRELCDWQSMRQLTF